MNHRFFKNPKDCALRYTCTYAYAYAYTHTHINQKCMIYIKHAREHVHTHKQENSFFFPITVASKPQKTGVHMNQGLSKTKSQ